MTRLLAYFLTMLLLLQSFGRELLVLNFAVNQASIAQRYCVNKARPSLRCNGKCYLARQLRRAENGPAKAPAGTLAKVKFEVVAPPAHLRLLPPVWVECLVAPRFARPEARPYVAAPLGGVFRPPIG
ncbi:MAG: hypothetical protein ACRYFX_32170 [Janthinobacterium lividum]